MDLQQFIEAPAGKGDSSTNRTVLRSQLDEKYYKLMKAPNKNIRAFFYKTKQKDVYYIHLIIPTETERTNSYDVVFCFTDTDGSHKLAPSILNYDIKVFCNAPSFAYTFAKVYADNDMLIRDLASKYDRDILRKAPDTRNRYGIINYDKYTYFAAKYLQESRMLNKTTLALRCITYSKTMLTSRVRDLETIMAEYKKAERKLKDKKNDRKKKQEKEREKAIDRIVGGNGIVVPKAPKLTAMKKKDPKKPTTKTMKSVKRVGSIKKK